MKLITQSGEMPVWLGERPDAGTNRLVDALVRVRGVLIYRDGRASLLAPSWANVEVLESAPANPFSIPTIAIDRLSEFSRHASSCHRVKIAGVVTCRNYKLFVVQDDSGGVEVETSNPGEVLVRDAVEVVGFADGPPGSIALSQAAVRKVGIAPMPAAVPISAEQLYSGDYDARVVRLDGVLLAQNIAGGNQVLELQSEQRVCRAELPNSRSRLNSIPVGSQVRVTGVSLSDHLGNSLSVGASGQSAASFGILLRGPEDVVILQWPPWWAWKHATLVIGTLAFVLAVAMLWIRYLRLKVERRTHQLKEAMSKLERETETSATLAERNRLAGEIHDGLEQGLSAIMMQLDGLESKLGSDPAGVARHLKLARSMVRFSRTEVRHSLWDGNRPHWPTPIWRGP